MNCPLCDSRKTFLFLQCPAIPIHQNLLMANLRNARELARGEMRLLCCEECGFIFNRAFDPQKMAYGKHYENAQTWSPFFREYVDKLLDYLVHHRNVHGQQVVEIGCGQGLFLRKLVEYPGAENTGIGFDPAYTGQPSDLEGRLRFEKRYYDASCAHIPADIVVCRHVIEHVPDPVGLLASVRRALASKPKARLFFETPCVEWILANQVVWDISYEHCSYFTSQSLRTAFERAGFAVREARHVFGGQYLWLEADNTGPGQVSRDPGKVPQLAAQFGVIFQERLHKWRRLIEELAGGKNLALWGAGGKGAIFAALVDPEVRFIPWVVDVNPHKQGHYLPGTGHPIVSPAYLLSQANAAALITNPNYRDEIERMLAEKKPAIPVIDLMELARKAA